MKTGTQNFKPFNLKTNEITHTRPLQIEIQRNHCTLFDHFIISFNQLNGPSSYPSLGELRGGPPNILLIVSDDLNTRIGPYMDIDKHTPAPRPAGH